MKLLMLLLLLMTRQAIVVVNMQDHHEQQPALEQQQEQPPMQDISKKINNLTAEEFVWKYDTNGEIDSVDRHKTIKGISGEVA